MHKELKKKLKNQFIYELELTKVSTIKEMEISSIFKVESSSQPIKVTFLKYMTRTKKSKIVLIFLVAKVLLQLKKNGFLTLLMIRS